MNKKTILVTGGAGFIGSHLVRLLLGDGYDVVVFEKQGSDLWRIKDIQNKINIYIHTSDDTDRVFQRHTIHAIIHLATLYIKQHQSPDEVADMVHANVEFPARLCDVAVQNNVKNFINTGTFFEYKTKISPLKETDEVYPYNFYAATKRAFASILDYYVKQHAFRSVELRLFAPFGEMDNDKLINFLMRSLGLEEKIPFSGGEQQWNFTYVRDIATAYVDALRYLDTMSDNVYEVFNIGYEKAVSIRFIAKKLEEISGKKLPLQWGKKPYVENEILYANCDNTKAKEMLGWRPEFNVESGLRRTYNFLMNK